MSSSSDEEQQPSARSLGRVLVAQLKRRVVDIHDDAIRERSSARTSRPVTDERILNLLADLLAETLATADYDDNNEEPALLVARVHQYVERQKDESPYTGYDFDSNTGILITGVPANEHMPWDNCMHKWQWDATAKGWKRLDKYKVSNTKGWRSANLWADDDTVDTSDEVYELMRQTW